jgi:hypothetical protein
MLRIILKILTFALPLIVNPAYTQNIWKEEFLIPEKGIWGKEDGSIRSDFKGITKWTIDTAGVNLSGPGDYAKTVNTSGGRFECRDIDGEVIWKSEHIGISQYDKINIRLTAYETGSGNNKETKYLKAFYRLNNGEETPFSINGKNYGNWGKKISRENELKGDSLRIICYIRNDYAADKVTLDEVTVWIKEKPLPPIGKNEILITEVLFNPYPGGEDFVEIYNNSEKPLPINRLQLANRDKHLGLTRIYPASESDYILQPGSYLAVTKDTNSISRWYDVKCPDCVARTDKMPPYNNDEGYVVLLNEEMKIVDELFYTEEMHSPFLREREGVSLERISFSLPAGKIENWHSASRASGYATPGYENSRAEEENGLTPHVSFEPDAFSPDLDGFNDQFLIHYRTCNEYCAVTIKIFDIHGRYIFTLVNNEIPDSEGTYKWNGEDETGRLLKPGVYIVTVVIVYDNGIINRYKDAVFMTRSQ